MNTVGLANEQVFAEVKRLCLMGLDSTTLRQRVTERLRSAVPFDGYVAFTMDPSSGLITHALVEEMGDESGLRVFLEHVYFEDDILEFNWMVQNRLPVGLLSEATGGKLELAPRYRELQAPAGLGYELRGAGSRRSRPSDAGRLQGAGSANPARGRVGPEKVAVPIARGLTNCRVACELTISEHTDSRPTKAFLTLL
jgi:hypothetical protein